MFFVYQVSGTTLLIAFIVWVIWYFIIKPIYSKAQNTENLGRNTSKCPYCNQEVDQGGFYCMNCRSLIKSDEFKKYIAKNPYQYEVKPDSIDVNDIPSVAGNHLFSLIKNDIVFVIALGEKIIDNLIWVQIKTYDGKVGWTAYKFLEKIQNN